MSTITDSFGVYQPDHFSEQEICNIRPKQRSGYNTPNSTRISSEQESRKCYPEVSLEYKIAVELCRNKLIEFFSKNDDGAARAMYGGWLSKYGCIFVREHFTRYLDDANGLLIPFKEQFPIISKADLFVLAASVSAKFLGAPDISFHPGRKDKDEPSNSNATSGNVFPKIRQLSNKEFLIFHCSHYNLRDIDEEGNKIKRPRTSKPRIDNSYCKELLTRRKEGHLLSPMDKIFLEDPVLHFLVKKYAADLNVFLADFTQAFVRLSELEFADV